MSSPLAASLAAALLALGGSSYSQAMLAQRAQRSGENAFNTAEMFLVISRPEASDIYVAPKVRISGQEILARNPDLVRANRDERAYDLNAVVRLAWRTMTPLAPATDTKGSEYLAAVPEPGSSALIFLSSILILRRRRPKALDEKPSSHERSSSSSAGADSTQETP